MPQSELLIRVIGALKAAELAYMITGSLASSVQGEPRATHDLDLVVDLPAEAVQSLLSALRAARPYGQDRSRALTRRAGSCLWWRWGSCCKDCFSRRSRAGWIPIPLTGT